MRFFRIIIEISPSYRSDISLNSSEDEKNLYIRFYRLSHLQGDAPLQPFNGRRPKKPFKRRGVEFSER